LLSTPILKTVGKVLAISAAVAARATGATTASATTTVSTAATTTAVSTATTTTAVSTATTAVSASATTGGTFFTRARDIHGEATSGKVLAVHACDSRIGFIRGRHGHEREAAGAACNAIRDQGDVGDGAVA
jgi:hypothetical protein